MKQQILFQVHYTVWATEALLDACQVLTPEEIERDLGGSHPTIARTFYHFFVSEEFWVQCLCAGTIPRLADIGGPEWLPGDPEPSVDAMRRKWPGIWSDLLAFLDSANEDELIGDLVGPDCRMPRWRLLTHMVNHSTLHRGQLTDKIRRLGKRPPNTDVFTYAVRNP
jgi:uncharacterized damage-inducible protein DinB